MSLFTITTSCLLACQFQHSLPCQFTFHVSFLKNLKPDRRPRILAVIAMIVNKSRGYKHFLLQTRRVSFHMSDETHDVYIGTPSLHESCFSSDSIPSKTHSPSMVCYTPFTVDRIELETYLLLHFLPTVEQKKTFQVVLNS